MSNTPFPTNQPDPSPSQQPGSDPSQDVIFKTGEIYNTHAAKGVNYFTRTRKTTLGERVQNSIRAGTFRDKLRAKLHSIFISGKRKFITFGALGALVIALVAVIIIVNLPPASEPSTGDPATTVAPTDSDSSSSTGITIDQVYDKATSLYESDGQQAALDYLNRHIDAQSEHSDLRANLIAIRSELLSEHGDYDLAFSLLEQTDIDSFSAKGRSRLYRAGLISAINLADSQGVNYEETERYQYWANLYNNTYLVEDETPAEDSHEWVEEDTDE